MSTESTKTCPYCAETINEEAVKCPYCQSDLASPPQAESQPQAPPDQPPQFSDSANRFEQPVANQNFYSGGNYVPHPEQLLHPSPRYSRESFTAPYIVWIISVILCSIFSPLGIILVLIGMGQNSEAAIAGLTITGFAIIFLSGIIGIGAIIGFSILLYRCWNVIQDGYATATPGMAVGLLFVPIFNVYWFIVATYILACEMNNYIKRYGMGITFCNVGLVLAWIILGFLPYVNAFNIFIAPMAVYTLMRTACEIHQIKMQRQMR